MMSVDSSRSVPAESPPTPRRWQPLEAAERRVLGVLVEKAKTTPESYPLSLNALRNGCNQKNNRSPLMQIEEEQVEDALESLRAAGAIAVIQGSGRVDKYRHLAYEWLGVEKVELAVMAELLLRGAQTIGELRGRAARMEPIKDLSELRPVLDSLQAKRLIEYLTPPGRGCVVTHTLYQQRELEKLRRETDTLRPDSPPDKPDVPAAESTTGPRRAEPTVPPAAAASLETELAQLREEVATLKRDFAATRADLESTTQSLRHDLDELHRQLGN